MLASKLFGSTLRDDPSDADFESHALLLRAGYIRPLSAGIYSLLPLGVLLARRLEAILREEMCAIGGQEVLMPVVQPAAPWRETGRYDAIDETMVRFEDRRGHPMVLAMTHEEVVALLAKSEVQSWRDLPRIVFQIQTKFRDERRPRGGLIRTREFIMKDSYSLCATEAELDEHYAWHAKAYFRIAERAALPVVAIASDTGDMGGSIAHEFTYLTDIGEDVVAVCSSEDYFANLEVAAARPPEARGGDGVEDGAEDQGGIPAPALIETPDSTSIESVATLLSANPAELLRALFLVTTGESPRAVIAVATGDREFNEIALARVLGSQFRRADEDELAKLGIVAGYGSPVGVAPEVTVVVDDHVQSNVGYIAGSNVAGYHSGNVVAGRDFRVDVRAAITKVKDGDGCPKCEGTLRLRRGIEYGNIFKLGTKYSSALGAKFTNEAGDEFPIIMGSYGIGLGRMLACVAEEHRDERGLKLPASVAPFVCSVVVATDDGWDLATSAYETLQAAAVTTLFDDRPLRAGAKFADADLRGFPIRVTVGSRSMKAGGVEVQVRATGESTIVPLDELVATVQRLVAEDETRTQLARRGDRDLVELVGALPA